LSPNGRTDDDPSTSKTLSSLEASDHASLVSRQPLCRSQKSLNRWKP